MERDGDVLYERDGAVAIVRLDRPHRKNAFSVGMSERLVEICEEIDADDTVGAAVICGAGGSFCAGADRAILDGVAVDPVRDDLFSTLGGVYQAFMRVGTLRAPTVSAVRGAAVGAGLNLALATDLRIVATEVRLIAGFLHIGIHPGGGHFKLLERLAGREAAAAITVFGEEIDGPAAVRLGIAWRECPDEQVESTAVELARRAAVDPMLARLAVKNLRGTTDYGVDWPLAMEVERSAQMWSLRRRHERRTSVDATATGR